MARTQDSYFDSIKAKKCGLIDSHDTNENHLWSLLINTKNNEARESLICLFFPYARLVAATLFKQRMHNEVDFSEYLQFACLGLIESVDRFDPTQGVLFRTFAFKRMKGAILNGLELLTEKNKQIAVRSQLHRERLQYLKEQSQEKISPKFSKIGESNSQKLSQQALFDYLAEVGIGVALSVLLDNTGMISDESPNNSIVISSPEIIYFRKKNLQELSTRVKTLVSQLSSQEQLVIRYHYLQDLSFVEIAQMLDLSRSRISQLHRQGLIALRRHLNDVQYCDMHL